MRLSVSCYENIMAMAYMLGRNIYKQEYINIGRIDKSLRNQRFLFSLGT